MVEKMCEYILSQLNHDLRIEFNEKEAFECVFIHKNGKALIKSVETGIQDEKYIEIKSGIEDVKKVVRGPFDAVSRKLSDGSNIIVSEKTKF